MARDCGDFAEFRRAREPACERFGVYKSTISAPQKRQKGEQVALENGRSADISADDAGGGIDLRFVPGGESKKVPPLSRVL
jgi:hypothetical protein